MVDRVQIAPFEPSHSRVAASLVQLPSPLLQQQDPRSEVSRLASEVGKCNADPAELRGELKGFKEKRGCPSCSQNVAFFRGQMAGRDQQLTEQRLENNNLISENEALKRRVQELLSANAGFGRIGEAAFRQIAVPLPRDRSRDADRERPTSQRQTNAAGQRMG